MTDATAMPDPTRAYVDQVRAALATGAPSAGAERGAQGAEASAAQAEALAPLSRDLTRFLAAGIAAPDPAQRLAASTRLLAKALADLEVTSALAAAEDGAGAVASGAERSLAGGTGVEEALSILIGGPPAAVVAERGGADVAAGDPEAARLELANAVEDVFDLVTERATRSGQAALTGLLGLGAGELAGAVGAVGTDLAGLVGQGEAAARLVAATARMAGEAANGITALLGPTVAGAAAAQVVAWVDAVRGGEKFAVLLGRLYDTPAALAAAQAAVGAAPADAERLVAAVAAVNGIDAAYAAQVKLAEQVLQKARFLTGIPAVALPQGRLIAAVVFLGLGGYIVLAGADFVDSPRLTLLSRAPGIPTVVAGALGVAF